ncbi:MAG: hypothetical protein C0602_12275 [Denitrovibrio sp.]|nr:MAG: hypothetical protein C0602_12275 [Denitrovibrio sp.]
MSEIKDLFYLGIGATMIAKERIEEEAKDLMERGKISREEQEAFVKKAKDKAKSEEKVFQDKFKESIKEVLSEMGLATKEDIEEIKKLLKK